MNLLPFLVSGLGLGSVYALSGVGLVVLYRASGVLNFALGALSALGAQCAWAAMQAGYPPLVGWLASIVAAALCSLLYGVLIGPRLSHRDRGVRAIGTLGLALALLGLIDLYWGELPRRLVLPTDQLYLVVFGARLTYTRLVALILAVIMVVGISLLMSRTRLGLSMRALANDREVSSVIGIPIVATDAAAWLLSGVLAGLSGVLLGDLVRLQPSFLTFLVIPAIAAAILGRLTSITGAAFGGMALGLIEAVLTGLPAVAPFRSEAPYLIALAFITALGPGRFASSRQ